MKTEDIIRFLKKNIEPLPDNNFGEGYRASVYLKDSTFLPCVIFRSSKEITALALRRFKEEQKGVFNKQSSESYKNIVKQFVTRGNCINEYDIQKVQKSDFAFPLKIQKQIRGETTMGWTGFALKMKDGAYFGFGTSFHWEFFEMPKGYTVDDITEVINHSYVLKNGKLCSHRQGPETRPKEYENAIVHREKPFFECFLDDL